MALVDNKFMASVEGILRLVAIGIGGAIFGTLAQTRASHTFHASTHFLMWVAVFAWAVSTITLIAGLFSNPLFSGGTEYRVNFVFAILYLIGAIVFGVFNVSYINDVAILVIVYACFNCVVYLTLFFYQFCSSECGKSLKEAMKPSQNPASGKEELKKDIDEEAGISADVVDSGREEPGPQPVKSAEE